VAKLLSARAADLSNTAEKVLIYDVLGQLLDLKNNAQRKGN
jgi:hypothetical protein